MPAYFTDPEVAADLRAIVSRSFHPAHASREAAVLRYLAGLLPEITETDVDLEWCSADASASVDVEEDLGVCVHFRLGDADPVILSDPLQTIRAILSAWMTTNPLEF